VAGSDLREFQAPDGRYDLPADVALVCVQGPGADPSSLPVREPADQVGGEADPIGAWIAASFDVPVELMEGALRILLGGEAALAFLASPAADGWGP